MLGTEKDTIIFFLFEYKENMKVMRSCNHFHSKRHDSMLLLFLTAAKLLNNHCLESIVVCFWVVSDGTL